jgi:Flp pilus assembly protein TadD
MKIATVAAARATETSDDPAVAWYNLAIFTSALGDGAGVERSLRNAMRLAPNWFKPHWTLANLLLLTGRNAEARTEAERAFILDGGKDPDVTATRQRASAVP